MTTSNPIAVRKVLLEPDDPELPGAAPGSNATACTANEPPCRCRGSAQRDRFRTTSSDASHARLERSAHRRPHDRFRASVGPQACERNRVKSTTREDRAARPLCDRERSSAFGPALMSRGVCRCRCPTVLLCAGRAHLPPAGRDRNADGLKIRARRDGPVHWLDARAATGARPARSRGRTPRTGSWRTAARG